MADFSLFVRNIRGVREMSEHMIFALFNDCLHMTEVCEEAPYAYEHHTAYLLLAHLQGSATWVSHVDER